MFSICCSCFWLLLPIASAQSSYLLVALLQHSLIRYFMKKLLCASFCRSFRTKQNQVELLVEYFPEYLFIFVTLQSVLPNKPRILSTTVDNSLLNLIKKQMTAGVLSVSWVLTKDLYSTLYQQQLSFWMHYNHTIHSLFYLFVKRIFLFTSCAAFSYLYITNLLKYVFINKNMFHDFLLSYKVLIHRVNK